MRPQHTSPRVSRFLRETEGNSGVEYSIFLAMVVGSILLAGMAVGVGTRTTFQRLAGFEPPVATLTSDSASVYHTQDAGMNSVQLIGLAVILAIGGIMWHVLYTLRKKPAAEMEDDDELRRTIDSVNRDALFEKRQHILKTLEEHLPLLFDDKVQVSHIMSRRLTSVVPDMPIENVRNKMKEHRMRHVLVCDTEGGLRGIISVRDIFKPGALTAAHVMTANPITVEPTQSLGPVISLLLQHRISCLPVVKDGHLFGIVTSTDINMTLQAALHLLARLKSDGRIHPPDSIHSTSATISALASHAAGSDATMQKA